jgi:(p)ppGpp synthase/HD superfamily hydrolase
MESKSLKTGDAIEIIVEPSPDGRKKWIKKIKT